MCFRYALRASFRASFALFTSSVRCALLWPDFSSARYRRCISIVRWIASLYSAKSRVLTSHLKGGFVGADMSPDWRHSSLGHSSGYLSLARSSALIGLAARNFACSIVSVTDTGSSSPAGIMQTAIALLTRQWITLSGPYCFLRSFNAYSNAISGYRSIMATDSPAP